MSDEQKYNQEHMDEICAKYESCISKILAGVEKLDLAKTAMIDNYEGQANDIAPETFAKIKEHLEFLSESMSHTSRYVSYTKETMVEQDNKIAEDLGAK